MTFTPKGEAQWWVSRGAQSPRTDEDAAMASGLWGPFSDRDAAQEELVGRAREEYLTLADRSPDNREALIRALRVVRQAELGSQHIVTGGLIWRAYPV